MSGPDPAVRADRYLHLARSSPTRGASFRVKPFRVVAEGFVRSSLDLGSIGVWAQESITPRMTTCYAVRVQPASKGFAEVSSLLESTYAGVKKLEVTLPTA